MLMATVMHTSLLAVIAAGTSAALFRNSGATKETVVAHSGGAWAYTNLYRSPLSCACASTAAKYGGRNYEVITSQSNYCGNYPNEKWRCANR